MDEVVFGHDMDFSEGQRELYIGGPHLIIIKSSVINIKADDGGHFSLTLGTSATLVLPA